MLVHSYTVSFNLFLPLFVLIPDIFQAYVNLKIHAQMSNMFVEENFVVK